MLDLYYKRPGGDIRKTRRALGLTQAALAKRAGCSVAYLGAIERGLTPAADSMALERIISALNSDTPAAANGEGVKAAGGPLDETS